MKTNKILTTLLAVIALFATAACKKDADFLYKGDMLPITISGYNGSDQNLTVRVDTLGKTFLLGAGLFNASEAFTFPEGQNTVKVTITEPGGKLVMEKEFRKEEEAAKINFFYLNGMVGNMPEAPAVEEGKVKLTYMWMPVVTKYTEPVDFVVGKLYFFPKVFEEITRIKNVKPGEFSETISINTFPTAGQTYNGQPTPVLFMIYVCKAGTNIPYTDGSGYTWSITTSAPKPSPSVAGSKLYIFSERPSGELMAFVKNLEI